MAATEDTEITLGTGKMLLLFFGLVVLCAVFFSMGFSLGRNSARPALAATDAPAGTTTVSGGPRPSAVKPVSAAPAPSTDQLTFYKSVEQKDTNAQLPPPAPPSSAGNNAPPENAAPQPSDNKPVAPDPMAALPVNGYYVQVAAVSKQEDAEALVAALKSKQYPAFSNAQPDKLFHVQVGPFNDVKDAELMRGKLVADGYNPILKK
jgi:cell division septation protein DedD